VTQKALGDTDLTLNKYSWNNNPCVRCYSLSTDEEHPCYYCGEPFSIGEIGKKISTCEYCGFVICPKCVGCLCGTSPQVQFSFQHLRDKYCCVYENFKEGLQKEDEEYLRYVPYFKEALDYCRERRVNPGGAL